MIYLADGTVTSHDTLLRRKGSAFMRLWCNKAEAGKARRCSAVQCRTRHESRGVAAIARNEPSKTEHRVEPL